MRTIVVADAVMGLDNVLAVAGAAHGGAARRHRPSGFDPHRRLGLDHHPALDRALPRSSTSAALLHGRRPR